MESRADTMAGAKASRRKYVTFLWIAGLVVVLDQISKLVIIQQLALYQSVSVIPGLFNITHIHNPGGAFGFLSTQSEGLRHGIFLGASIVAMGAILYFYVNTPPTHRFLGAALAMIFGGAVGNIIDRIRFGEVVDFLDFYLGRYHWPAFNVADSAITIGIGIFILHLLLGKIPD
jgi:signal peptidase II